MARTKASVGAKISSGKSTKAQCSATPPPSNSGSSSGERSSRNSYTGGNPWCQREIPAWQKPITNFFKSVTTAKKDSESEEISPSASSSKPKSSKRNVIESDEEEEEADLRTEINEPLEVDEYSPEKPKNRVLDETIDLEPLTGENSHKIEEYYPLTRNNNAGNLCDDKENLPSGSNSNSMDVSDSNNNSDANEHNDIKYKGKGKGKKSNKDKLNADTRKSVKRDLEQVIFGEESQHVKKKIKS